MLSIKRHTGEKKKKKKKKYTGTYAVIQVMKAGL